MPQITSQEEVCSLIEARNFTALKAAISDMQMPDLTELLGKLEREDLALVFRLLPQQMAADIFGDLEIEQQEELASTLSGAKLVSIVNDMPPDERTELLEELPGELAQRLLNSLRGDELRIARSLLAYPEESIGRLMTPEYIAAHPDWTISRILEHIRKVAHNKETLSVIFIVNDRLKLLDDVPLERLILADPDMQVSELMDEQFATLVASDDQESAIEMFKKYEAVALPVVNSQGILVGIVTIDDVMDVTEEESTEDFQKMAGMGPLEHSYFGTGYFSMIRKRFPWLAVLLIAQTLTTVTLLGFQSLPLFVVLVMFVPLINSPAGNTGSQMAGLMLRGLAVQELELGDWGKVLARELLRGATLGLFLAIMGYVAAYIFSSFVPIGPNNPNHIAMSVAISLILAVTLANLIGSMLPFFFKRIGVDPATTSGPFIASMMDVSSIMIYFSTATILLKAVGQ